jgi:Secretion system C-terminal sorting domain
LKDQVVLYPNPTSGLVTIGFALNNNAPVHVEVFNLTGSKVTELKNISGGFGSQILDLGRYGNGTYMVRITNNGETTTRKIVVTQ